MKKVADEKYKNKILISENGPYVVDGNFPLQKEIAVCGKNGIPIRWEKKEKISHEKKFALCRCGASKNKPFCDGSHLIINFDGNETANNIPFLKQCEVVDGKNIFLRDAPDYCAVAKFCHRNMEIWDAVQNVKSEKIAIDNACDCPSGRLVIYDKKTGKAIEPKFAKSISLTEEDRTKVLGPIWVKGGIPIESFNGTKYEIRNRVTLCRCGKSANKPFCDGSHLK